MLFLCWKNTSNNEKVIMEHKTWTLRVKYLHAIRAYAEEGRQVVYTVHMQQVMNRMMGLGRDWRILFQRDLTLLLSILVIICTCMQSYLNLHSAHCSLIFWGREHGCVLNAVQIFELDLKSGDFHNMNHTSYRNCYRWSSYLIWVIWQCSN
jgi:hypothetical protein